jgi:PAS domain S-box-containing protein
MTDLSGDASRGAQEGSDMYQQLFEQLDDYALFRVDAEGCISLWPPGAERLYGYEAADLLGQPLDVLCADTQAAPTAVESLLAEAQDESVETEGWHERADGSVFWATCVGCDSTTPVG